VRGIDSSDFDSLVEPLRGALRLHCYRLTGSLDDAEDLVQETFLRAWRRRDTLADRGALRAWLYRIATNACLDARAVQRRRTLPSLTLPSADPALPPAPPSDDVYWLQPFPDTLWPEALRADERHEPEARYSARESVTLAFLAALQTLTPRERVALVLCDVLDWPAREAAACLAWTVSSINSALHRARARIAERYPAGSAAAAFSQRPAPLDAGLQATLDRYVRAWETDDVGGLVALLREDATLAMPPSPTWYAGREAIGRFLSDGILVGTAPGRWRLVPAGANGQPAFAVYQRTADAAPAYAAFGLHVLTLAPAGTIGAITAFLEPRWADQFGPLDEGRRTG
jgi:RNA polymerase sigma-70 factor (ECF subfamily)